MHTHCSTCGGPKKVISMSSHMRSICQPCINKQSYKRTISSAKTRAIQIWGNVKNRAERKNIEFNISRQWVIEKITAGVCEVSGVQLELQSLEDINNPMSPSIDRIDPKRGYIHGNIRVVCWIYNRAKGDGTDQDVNNLMEALCQAHLKNKQAS